MTFVAALFFLGVMTGMVGALLGIGGGIFLVPLLTLLFHLPIRTAVGTSLVGVIATSAGVAAMMPPGRGANIPLALRLEMTATAGAVTGGLIAGSISPRGLGIIFAIAVLATAGYTLYKARRQTRIDAETLFARHYQIHHWPLGMGLCFFAGLASGLLGVGGGFIKVPIMYSIMGVPLGIATATSNFMSGITAAASVFVYYGRGDVYPEIVIPTALGIFTGAMLGVRLMPHLRVSWLRMALVGLLTVIGLQMLVTNIR